MLSSPESIRIFGRTYQVVKETAGGLGQDRVGSCDNLNQIIIIDALQSPIEEADTTFHETLHGIAYTMKLGLDPELEERIVSAFATGILGVLQDNPEFGLWLCENKSQHIEEAA